MQVLTQQREAGQVDGKWFLHTAGCLEDQNRLEEALAVIQAGLATNGRQGPIHRGFKLHLATTLNYYDRPDQVLELLKSNGRLTNSDPGLSVERARALFALNRYADALREIKQILALGHDVRWIYYIQGVCYQQLNRPAKALKALEKAEQRDWMEPEINDAKARCLQRMGRPREAKNELAKAGRKRRYLLVPASANAASVFAPSASEYASHRITE
jgi:tetratricopeptide (TPR) repeat protein